MEINVKSREDVYGNDGKTFRVSSSSVEFNCYTHNGSKGIELKIMDREFKGSGKRYGTVKEFEKEGIVRLSFEDINRLLEYITKETIISINILTFNL